ncbi:hypothetical protein PP304_gp135 [Gordonia phage Phendrix]|uniref:Uncharacterized protein n=1 Tax=Gordonia phage Phendrix TaxID=2593335 RepID=A0A514U0T8_9CAUD|nr:hypothetical protein PP304_gp002 [Gordonia phage Phendrix]YP_010649232.1 hypothetical protein PP304_gp135 [Gordonia phage Phendrix]QDK02550.1 hypothetical protein SEA_PHENDRIX_2 [Gordonia phage Phendrix]QDK02734.1 hypothetical protein SEA_PHENDRIX_218 [Gordonia phage Phendrix]
MAEKAESASLPRKGTDVQIDAPLWEWAPPFKGTKRSHQSAREKAKATTWLDTRDQRWWINAKHLEGLPPKRVLRTKFTYRQFLHLLWTSSELYVHARVAFETGTPITELDASRKAEISSLRKRLRPVRNFSKLVLNGGPEGQWLGKTLRPEEVHEEVVKLHASGSPGFDAMTVAASSTAWEMFAEDTISVEEYALLKQRKDLPGVQTKEGYDLHRLAKHAARAETSLVRAEPHTVREYMPDTGMYAGVGSELAKKITNPLEASGVVDPATGEIKHVRCQFVFTRDVLEAMGSSVVHRDVKENSQCANMAVPGTIRCEMHGGLYASPDETRRLVVSSQLKMFTLADQAVATIADIMMHGTNEATRLRAAETILNRSGITEGNDFEMPSLEGKKQGAGEDATDKIKRRLQKLASVTDEDLERIRAERDERTAQQRADHEQHRAPGHEVIEGEVVEGSAEVGPDEREGGDGTADHTGDDE